MAKLYFRYSAMGAGKTLDLLKTAFNYEERSKRVLLFTSDKDNRFGVGRIQSRTGLGKDAIALSEKSDIHLEFSKFVAEYNGCDCILVDEAQFLTSKQIDWLCKIVDIYNIPVICYGLRVRYTGLPFPGSTQLMAIADEIEEIKTICHCGRKATMNALVRNGAMVYNGDDVIDNEEAHENNTFYVPLCRKHWREGNYGKLK